MKSGTKSLSTDYCPDTVFEFMVQALSGLIGLRLCSENGILSAGFI